MLAMDRTRLRYFLLLAALAAACTRGGEQIGADRSALPGYDILIRGGTVVDGTGAPRFVADVAIRDARIFAVEPPGTLDAGLAMEVLEAEGLIVAPGFIDNHAHIQTSIHRYPLAENFTRQGITTILASLHSGNQPWPFGEYLDALEVAPNVGFFAGHTWTRRRVLGNENRAPTEAELGEMMALVGGFSAIYHAMVEEDVERIMRHPFSMFDTDGDNVAYGIGFPHPRSYGTFPRILGRYVRQRQVITLEEAIRKMTSLSADQIGQFERGRIGERMYADITVFDFDTIIDRATYTDPHQYSVGVMHVLVNGVPVMRDAALTGARPGRVLRGPARPDAVR